MNCDDVMDLLDNQRPERLDAGQRRQAEAHVTVCAECARAWNLQAELAALPDLALPADFAASCRALVAAGPRIAAGRRGGNRTLLVAGLAAVAAAAALLVFVSRPTAPVSSLVVVQAAKEAAAPAPAGQIASNASTPEAVPAIAVEAVVPVSLFTVRVIPYEVATSARLEAAGLSEAERSWVLEMAKANTADPARVPALQSLHAALLEELQKVPGLTLVKSDPSEVRAPSRHFRLKIGFFTMGGADGRLLPIDRRYVMTELGAEELQAGGKSASRESAYEKIDLQAVCDAAARTAETPCNDVRGVAIAMVEAMRRNVFPPERSFTRALQARFRDASVETAERFNTLDEILALQNKNGELGLLRDPGVVRAALELAANADPASRARLWRRLGGVGNPSLVEPLINSLSQDPDDVRLAALETLTADFSADPRVRSALQATAAGDSRPLVRAVAERALSGEAGWRQYVLGTLKDTNGSVTQRIEALMFYLYPPALDATSVSNQNYWRDMKETLDDEAVRMLARILPDADVSLRNASRLERFNVRNFAGNFGGQFGTNPAVTDMNLRFLEHGTEPLYRMIGVQSLALQHGSEPRVRAALNKAMENDPDPEVRDWIRQVLGLKAP